MVYAAVLKAVLNWVSVRIRMGVQMLGWRNWFNSPLFQGGDYGFEAHTEYEDLKMKVQLLHIQRKGV